MKRLFLIALIALLVVSLLGCGPSEEEMEVAREKVHQQIFGDPTPVPEAPTLKSLSDEIALGFTEGNADTYNIHASIKDGTVTFTVSTAEAMLDVKSMKPTWWKEYIGEWITRYENWRSRYEGKLGEIPSIIISVENSFDQPEEYFTEQVAFIIEDGLLTYDAIYPEYTMN